MKHLENRLKFKQQRGIVDHWCSFHQLIQFRLIACTTRTQTTPFARSNCSSLVEMLTWTAPSRSVTTIGLNVVRTQPMLGHQMANSQFHGVCGEPRRLASDDPFTTNLMSASAAKDSSMIDCPFAVRWWTDTLRTLFIQRPPALAFNVEEFKLKATNSALERAAA